MSQQAPAGRLLEKLAQTPFRVISFFGSAPLQIFLDSGFLSQDCDLIGDETLASFCHGDALRAKDHTEVREITEESCKFSLFILKTLVNPVKKISCIPSSRASRDTNLR